MNNMSIIILFYINFDSCSVSYSKHVCYHVHYSYHNLVYNLMLCLSVLRCVLKGEPIHLSVARKPSVEYDKLCPINVSKLSQENTFCSCIIV